MASWFVIKESREREFQEEVTLRTLRKMSPAQLLSCAEDLALQLMDANVRINQAAVHIAELECNAALRDAKPVARKPSPRHLEWAQALFRDAREPR